MRMRSSSVTISTPKVVSEIHHASRLLLPWLSSSPRLGVPGGTPRPRKSRLVSAPIAAAISNGTSVTTGVRLLGRVWRRMILQLLCASARGTRVVERPVAQELGAHVGRDAEPAENREQHHQ